MKTIKQWWNNFYPSVYHLYLILFFWLAYSIGALITEISINNFGLVQSGILHFIIGVFGIIGFMILLLIKRYISAPVMVSEDKVKIDSEDVTCYRLFYQNQPLADPLHSTITHNYFPIVFKSEVLKKYMDKKEICIYVPFRKSR